MESVQRQHKDFKKEFLTCSICREAFDDKHRVPKCLPCLHCFCKSCLRRLAASQAEIHCPNCRKKCIVPESGADGFVTNFNVENLREYQNLHQHDQSLAKKDEREQVCTNCDSGDVAVSYCYDCEAHICQTCTHAHTTWRLLKSHEIATAHEYRNSDRQKATRKMRKERCRVHKKDLSAFCKTCYKPICDTCGITDHREHEIQNLDTAIEEAVTTLSELANKVQSKKEPTKRLSGMIDSRINDINAAFTQRQEGIEEQFQELERKLRERCRQSKEELQDRCQVLTKLLQEQKADVEALAAQYDSACDFAEQTCEYASPFQLFNHQEMVSQQLNDLILTNVSPNEPRAHSYLVFTRDNDAAVKWFEDHALPRIGETRTSDTLASRCQPEGEIKPCIGIDIPQSVFIRAGKFDGKPQTAGGDPFTAELLTPDGTSSPCEIHDNQDGTYKITYVPKNHGEHHLDVRVFGRPIQGSPYPIRVRPDSTIDTNRGLHVDIPVALVGYPHEVSLSLFHEEDDLEKEARVDRIHASIVTQTGESVKCQVNTRGDGQYNIRHTPPVDGMLTLNIIVNGTPAEGNPYTIPVQSASPKATTVLVGQPIRNQVWSITVAPHDCRQMPISVPEDAIRLKITNLESKTEQDLSCTRNNDGTVTFACIPAIGPHLVSASLFNVSLTEKKVHVKERLEFNLPQSPQSFPTGIATGTSNVVYVSDTTDGSIHCFGVNGTQESCINLDTNKSSQIAVDDQGRLLLLFPQTKMIHVIDQQGTELIKWQCQKRNSRPVAIASTKEGRIVVADTKIPSLYIYKSDGDIISNEGLPKQSVVDGVNNICVDKQNNIILAHHSQPTVHIYNSDGNLERQFKTGATSFQLAVATTKDGHLLLAQLGSIRILHLVGDNPSILGEIAVVSGHIYTSLTSTNDGCLLGLEVGQKRLVKYGCQLINNIL